MGVEQEPSTNLTVEQCEAFAAALFEDTAILPPGPENGNLTRAVAGHNGAPAPSHER